jgi:hypothetical protein
LQAWACGSGTVPIHRHTNDIQKPGTITFIDKGWLAPVTACGDVIDSTRELDLEWAAHDGSERVLS